MIGIFSDSRKAYDRTRRNLILSTLVKWNIEGNMLHFVSNFLNNRKFKVIIGNNKSELLHQNTGVLQGEILSVLLFLIAINSSKYFIPSNIKYLLYADDLVLFIRSKQVKFCVRKLQIGLNKLHDWTLKTGFKFSVDKTKASHFFRLRKLIPTLSIYLNTTSIEFINNHVYSGITFDRRLKNYYLTYTIKYFQ